MLKKVCENVICCFSSWECLFVKKCYVILKFLICSWCVISKSNRGSDIKFDILWCFVILKYKYYCEVFFCYGGIDFCLLYLFYLV